MSLHTSLNTTEGIKEPKNELQRNSFKQRLFSYFEVVVITLQQNLSLLTDRQKKILFALFLGLITVILLFFSILNGGDTSTFDDQSDTLDGPFSVEKLAGDVEFRGQNREIGWMTIPIEEKNFNATLLRTLHKGQAVVFIDDGNSGEIRLDVNTEISLLNDDGVYRIKLNEGRMYVRSLDRDIVVLNDETQIVTQEDAFLLEHKDRVSGVHVYSGDLALNIESKQNLVTAGQKYFIENGDDPRLEGLILPLNLGEDIQDGFVDKNRLLDTAKEYDLGIFAEYSNQIREKEDELRKLVAQQIPSDDTITDTRGNNSEEEGLVEGPPPRIIDSSGVDIQITDLISGTRNQFSISWEFEDLNKTIEYFAIVFSRTENPVIDLEEKNYVIVENDQRTYLETLSYIDEGFYYVRVCDFDLQRNVCQNYSDQKSVAVVGTGYIPSDLNLEYSDEDTLVWKGGNEQFIDGYQIVKNSIGTPVFPEDAMVYLRGNEFETNQKGFYRVCAWDKFKGCVEYSNEVEVQ